MPTIADDEEPFVILFCDTSGLVLDTEIPTAILLIAFFWITTPEPYTTEIPVLLIDEPELIELLENKALSEPELKIPRTLEHK